VGTITQSELIEIVHESLEAPPSKREVGDAVKATFDAVFEALADGDEVTIPSFGKFEVRQVAARVGRNPRTGERVDIPAHSTPKFKPSSTLKAAVK